MSPSRSVLLVGEGNFSFSSSVCKLDSESGSNITATCLQHQEEALRHDGAAANIQTIKDSGGSVLFEVDCTKLGECAFLKGRVFDRVVFNFPHCGRKSGVKKNRELLKNFFLSCVEVLAGDGEVHVSLCNGQGGTPADQPKREWHNSWQVSAMAAEAHLILSAVRQFESDNLPSYKSTGYRSQDKGFHVEKALLHVFSRSAPFTPVQIVQMEEVVEGEIVHYNIPAELSDYVSRGFLSSDSIHPVKLVQDFLLEGLGKHWPVSMKRQPFPLLISAKQLQTCCHDLDSLQYYWIHLLQKELTSQTQEDDAVCSNIKATSPPTKADRVRSKGTESLQPVCCHDFNLEVEEGLYLLRPSLLPQLEELLINTDTSGNAEPQEEIDQSRGGQVWAPEGSTAFKCLLSARFCAALLSNISDCDETFNYWEPMHFLLYGTGMQTWEYSPLYAIRSYAYLWLHALPACLHAHVLQTNKVLVFYFVRCVLAFCCCVCELYFYKAVCKKFGLHVGRLMLAFLVLSTGMFCSSAAFLPSSFCMYTTLIAMTGWFQDSIPLAVMGVAAGGIVGWPFSALIGFPIAFDLLVIKREWKSFLIWCALALLLLLVPLVAVDSFFYGKLVIAPLNILLYNVFTEHGPDLYGTEPWHFYFLNGVLNFNLVFVLALFSLPLTALMETLLHRFNVQNLGRPYWLTLSPMYLWMLVFFTRPHKEERFLFPIYPLICLSGAVALSSLQKCYHFLFQRYRLEHYTVSSNWLALTTVVAFTVLSLSRSVALFRGYHAPLDLYPEFHRIAKDPTLHSVPDGRPVSVCVGKEWYRFPSSFLLPHNWQLHFIQSAFKGQLPQPYASGPQATQIIPANMNDQNLEEPSRYVDIKQCHYLVDLETDEETPLEPRYSTSKEEWSVVAYKPFLQASRSSPLFRAFYIPFISDHHTTYRRYMILKARRQKQPRKRAHG
ncbi:alpha-1,2-mannosyltransferase ALG9 isoform X2 [Poecilia formosa]|uniref:alpha-1,2-mannosyltransferase ALG9 isoform X2 n=1 Tax=Poecilia formosa TaxID=48698 RepID=UPI0004442B87|nr:PREDICTED: alpha-1,2-mannosyltransferase ALG9 isoform X2 [Poecilia formosa]